MNEQYFKTNEKTDIQLLYEFNEEHKFFDAITPTKEKEQFDAIAWHKTRTFAVELKHRFIPISRYKTLFIEDYKLAALMLEYIINKREPLYINFLHDAIVIFNLNKLSIKPKMTIKDIKSEGYEHIQKQERRFELNLKDAVIYMRK
jgi:hypothetical protein